MWDQYKFKCTIPLDNATNTPTITLQTGTFYYQAFCAFVECFMPSLASLSRSFKLLIEHDVFAEENLLICHQEGEIKKHQELSVMTTPSHLATSAPQATSVQAPLVLSIHLPNIHGEIAANSSHHIKFIKALLPLIFFLMEMTFNTTKLLKMLEDFSDKQILVCNHF